MSLWFSIKFSCSNSITSQPQNYFMADNQYTSQTVIVNWCVIKRKLLLDREEKFITLRHSLIFQQFFFLDKKYMLIKTTEKWAHIKNDKFIYLLKTFRVLCKRGNLEKDEFV